MFSQPSNQFRLEGAALKNRYTAGRDLGAATTALEKTAVDLAARVVALEAEKAALVARVDDQAARLAALELWSLTLTANGPL